LCKHDIDINPPKNHIVEQFETWFNYLKKFNNSKEIVLAREIIRSENLLSNQVANIEEIKQIQIKRIKKIKNDFIIKKKGVKLSENKEVRREINDKYPPHLLEADEDELPLDDFEVENVKQDIEQEILNLELERNQLLNYRTKLKTNNSNI
jgi:hypothetical protein